MANWSKIGSRGNVEDRRGFAPVVGGISLTGLAILLVVNYLLGGDPMDVLTQIEDVPVQVQQNVNSPEFEGEDTYEVFASTVLGSNNDTWESLFSQINRDYEGPRLVLFRMGTESDCGSATSEVGPHYCPLDKTIYLDETFFDELQNRFGARGGDVAEAYVISHEVGHHIQNLLGILQRAQSKEASIAVELQADCFAGLWANSLKDKGIFEANEIIEAMDAAAAVGDDRIQEKATGYVNPETWTHGSAEQRVEAFTRGYEGDSLYSCGF